MKVTSLSELRRNLGRVIDEATDDHEPVLITRDRGKPAAVLMSLEDFASYEETAHLLRSPPMRGGCGRVLPSWRRDVESSARENYLYWQGHDRKLLAKLNGLIEECLRTPYSGRGKPEPLRNELSGW